jgi:hypothetical protein
VEVDGGCAEVAGKLHALLQSESNGSPQQVCRLSILWDVIELNLQSPTRNQPFFRLSAKGELPRWARSFAASFHARPLADDRAEVDFQWDLELGWLGCVLWLVCIRPVIRAWTDRMMGDLARSIASNERLPWHLPQFSQTGGKGEEEPVVALVDAWADPNHPALQSKVAKHYRYVKAAEGGGLAEAEFDHSENERLHPRKPYHGTVVAGLVCGKGIGVAPTESVLSILFDSENAGGPYEALTAAIVFVCEETPARIVNFSATFRGTPKSSHLALAYENALREAGKMNRLVILAAGNTKDEPGGAIIQPRYPGGAGLGLVVGAADQQGKRCEFSLRGELPLHPGSASKWEVPDILAPGERLVVCAWGGGYQLAKGTSFAAAVASGAAARVLRRLESGGVLASGTSLRKAILGLCVKGVLELAELDSVKPL